MFLFFEEEAASASVNSAYVHQYLLPSWKYYQNGSILAAPPGMWDLTSPTRDQTYVPAGEPQSLNH